jgi:hypothetical protein
MRIRPVIQDAVVQIGDRDPDLKVPLIWVEGRMKKKNPSSGIGLPKRIETAGFAL